MRRLRVDNRSRDRLLGDAVDLADTWWRRLRGLLGRPALEAGEGLLLGPCAAVHMLGMHYPIDVLFVTADRRVTALYPALAPNDRTAWHREAHWALELPAGAIAATATQLGDTLDWSDA